MVTGTIELRTKKAASFMAAFVFKWRDCFGGRMLQEWNKRPRSGLWIVEPLRAGPSSPPAPMPVRKVSAFGRASARVGAFLSNFTSAEALRYAKP
jgi:hypothetical protein